MTREEAINAITQFIENYAYGNDLIGLKMAIEALKERPHGEWKEVCDFDGNHYKWECSVCGRLEEFEEDFCNCGADMRKEGDSDA